MSKKIRIHILKDTYETESDNTILHALQLYALARNLPLYGFRQFCWNASCRQCILKFCPDEDCLDEGCAQNFACQNQVTQGMQIKSIPKVLKWHRKLEIEV